jgi:hypothetical protein
VSLLYKVSGMFGDRVSIVVRRDRIAVARTGARTRMIASHSENVEADGMSSILEALETLLADSRWRDAAAHVVLSDSLVRYTMLPESAELVTVADESALALHRIRHIHGGGAGDWNVRIGNPLDDGAQPVAAVESAFVSRLGELLQAAGLRVRAIEPVFMCAYNRARARISGDRFWFASLEPGTVCLARAESGRWRSVAVRASDGDFDRVLAAMMNEARLAGVADGEDGRCFAYAPAIPWTDTGLMRQAGWENLATGVWAGSGSGESSVSRFLGI